MRKTTGWFAVALMALVLTLGVSACGFSKASTFTLDINDETGALMIEAENADGMVSSEIEVGMNAYLQLSPVLDKGKIQVQLKQGDEVTFDQTVDGKILSTYEVAPGSYTVVVTAVDSPTGSMTIYAVDQAEFDAMEESAGEALAAAEAEAAAQN